MADSYKWSIQITGVQTFSKNNMIRLESKKPLLLLQYMTKHRTKNIRDDPKYQLTNNCSQTYTCLWDWTKILQKTKVPGPSISEWELWRKYMQTNQKTELDIQTWCAKFKTNWDAHNQSGAKMYQTAKCKLLLK